MTNIVNRVLSRLRLIGMFTLFGLMVAGCASQEARNGAERLEAASIRALDAAIEASGAFGPGVQSQFIAEVSTNTAVALQNGVRIVTASIDRRMVGFDAFTKRLGALGYSIRPYAETALLGGQAAIAWDIARTGVLPTQRTAHSGVPLSTTNISATGGNATATGGTAYATAEALADAIADGSATLAIHDGAFVVTSNSETGPITNTLTSDQVAHLQSSNVIDVVNDNTNTNGVTVTNNLTGMPMCGMAGGPNCPPMGGGD